MAMVPRARDRGGVRRIAAHLASTSIRLIDAHAWLDWRLHDLISSAGTWQPFSISEHIWLPRSLHAHHDQRVESTFRRGLVLSRDHRCQTRVNASRPYT